MQDLRNKVILITGGTRGIGLATAKAFLNEGAIVATFSDEAGHVEQARAELEQLGTVFVETADVRDWEGIQAFVQEVLNRYGTIDVLVNNAGVVYSGYFSAQEQAHIEEMLDVNVKGLFYITRLVLPAMEGKTDAKIINVSSGAGKYGFPLLAVYSATKFAVRGFTESLAREVAQAGQNIQVYSICPGAVATEMQEEVSGARVGIPPEQVAEVILETVKKQPPLDSGSCLEI